MKIAGTGQGTERGRRPACIEKENDEDVENKDEETEGRSKDTDYEREYEKNVEGIKHVDRSSSARRLQEYIK